MKIAVDGPAGAGKSTIAKLVAEKVKCEYIDSGAIYRAITKKILDTNIKIDDYTTIEEMLKSTVIKLDSKKVFIDGRDVTPFIREKDVTESVSPVSSNVKVREKVNSFLNEYSQDKNVIMDGRDIGTVVFPDADHKFYLDASVEVRAKRRLDENPYKTTLDEIMDSIRKRDENDKNKKVGALKVAEGAVFIDTSLMSIDEVVDKILSYI